MGLNHLNDSEAFIEPSSDMDDIYELLNNKIKKGYIKY